MHRRDLEIRHRGKADVGKQDKPAFHFSSDNDGYYGIFDYYTHEKPYNRRTTPANDRSRRRQWRIAACTNRPID
jgi:hypothetical protein